MDTSNVRLLQYGPINIMLFTVWTHQTYVVYIMDPSNVRLIQYGPIKLNLPNVCCLDHVHIKPTLFTVCTIKPTLLKALTNLQYETITLTLFISWIHHNTLFTVWTH
jgi:hypothetical protein